MITEAAIKAALKSAPTSGKKTVELKDDGRRGEGRLALIIRVAPGRLTPEWYAVWYTDDKRSMAKIGTYPTLALVDARKKFREEFAPKISQGEKPVGPRARVARDGGNTFKDLCEAYVETLKGRPAYDRAYGILIGGAPGSTKAKRVYDSAMEAIGERKPAKAVTTEDCIRYLKAIHDRGSVSQAEHSRAYLSAAFTWAIKSSNSYHLTAKTHNWELTINPVEAIDRNESAYREGQRNLSAAELRHFWNWLGSPAVRSRAAVALKIELATGQRPAEIFCLVPDNATMEAAAARTPERLRLGVYDAAEKMFYWPWTKNGLPHSIPVPDQAADLLADLKPNKHGLYFWADRKPAEPLQVQAGRYLVERYLELHPEVPKFIQRDIRRTWKTLSGRAGISKEWRDRLQNHSLGDVASKHYDRYDYLPEKRAAMKTWSAYLARILSGEIDTPVAALNGRAEASH